MACSGTCKRLVCTPMCRGIQNSPNNARSTNPLRPPCAVLQRICLGISANPAPSHQKSLHIDQFTFESISLSAPVGFVVSARDVLTKFAIQTPGSVFSRGGLYYIGIDGVKTVLGTGDLIPKSWSNSTGRARPITATTFMSEICVGCGNDVRCTCLHKYQTTDPVPEAPDVNSSPQTLPLLIMPGSSAKSAKGGTGQIM